MTVGMMEKNWSATVMSLTVRWIQKWRTKVGSLVKRVWMVGLV